MNENYDIKAAWARLIKSLIDRPGWDTYILTFTFKPLNASGERRREIFYLDVQGFYSKFVTRAIRCPLAAANAPFLPILFCAPDLPVPKSQKRGLVLGPNAGLHLHGLLLVSPESRPAALSAATHIREEQENYRRNIPHIQEIHAEKVTRTPDVVIDYVLKSIMRGIFNTADILVLPRARSELS